MVLSLCFTTQRQAAVGYIEETPTEKSVQANSDLLLGEASLGGDLVDLLLLQLQLGARVAHLKEAAASWGEVLALSNLSGRWVRVRYVMDRGKVAMRDLDKDWLTWAGVALTRAGPPLAVVALGQVAGCSRRAHSLTR